MAPPPDTADWQTLLTGDWTMPPGTEGYVCARKTTTEDLYVAGFEAIIPPGTHHTLLTMGPPDAPDGVRAVPRGGAAQDSAGRGGSLASVAILAAVALGVGLRL